MARMSFELFSSCRISTLLVILSLLTEYSYLGEEHCGLHVLVRLEQGVHPGVEERGDEHGLAHQGPGRLKPSWVERDKVHVRYK